MKTKVLFMTLSAVFAVSSLFGQDLIVKRNAEQIEAKVTEITDAHVKYHKASNPDGPLYNIAKSEVSMIRYANGDQDVFVAEEAATETETKSAPPVTEVSAAPAASTVAAPTLAPMAPVQTVAAEPLSGELTIRKNSAYWIGDKRMSRTQVLRHVAPYDDVAANIKAGYKMKRAAVITGSIGAGIAASGILFMLAADGYDYEYDSSYYYNDALFSVGAGFLVTGLIIGLPAIGLGIGSMQFQKKAVRLYNSYIGYADLSRPGMILSMAATPGGLGLQLKF